MSARIKPRRVSQRLAKLLDLDDGEARLPQASRIRLSQHAFDRFRERVEPDLSAAGARRLLIDLKRDAHVRRERPGWLNGEEEEARRVLEVVGYIVIEATSPRCALPVVRARAGDHPWVATTCLI